MSDTANTAPAEQAAPSLAGLITTKEAGAYLGLSESLLNKLRLTGGGPVFVRLAGRSIRYRRADLDAWVAASVMQSTSQYPDSDGRAQ